MSKSENIDFKTRLSQTAAKVEKILETLLKNTDIQPRILEAMQYSLLDGGKRLRGCITMWSCEIINGQVNENAKLAAAAVEMVHCYSLIHDDLPAMDNDDFRRGKPSSHKAFDEATAILAGDGLLTYAFEILGRAKPEKVAVNMIQTLAQAAGPAGMIAGQMADVEAENAVPAIDKLEYIHTNKTAKMFAASAVMGALAAGAEDKQIENFRQFGLKLGLCFQIADDILDVESTCQELGKTAGKDAAQGKMTYPALMGIEKARQIKEKLTAEAAESLKCFDNADILVQLVEYLLKRKM